MGYKNVISLDEAGCGSLAGPVVAGAVSLDSRKFVSKFADIRGVRDSKKLSAKKREQLYKILTKHPLIKWGIGVVSEKIIDKINIKNAAELAMEKALNKLKSKCRNSNARIDYLIIDGNRLKNLKLKNYSFKLIVKADAKVLSCAMASILAKVTRDKIMAEYHKKYPKYGFNKHKGYPTKKHLLRLRKYGPCKIHRKSFLPVSLAK